MKGVCYCAPMLPHQAFLSLNKQLCVGGGGREEVQVCVHVVWWTAIGVIVRNSVYLCEAGFLSGLELTAWLHGCHRSCLHACTGVTAFPWELGI